MSFYTFGEVAITNTWTLQDKLDRELQELDKCLQEAVNIITLYNVSNIWRIRLLLKAQKAHEGVLGALNLLSVAKEPDLEEWTARAQLCDNLQEPVRIAMVGKYTGLSDSYLSLLKALLHASVICRRKLMVDWVASSDLEEATAKETPDVHKAAWNLLKGADGILLLLQTKRKGRNFCLTIGW